MANPRQVTPVGRAIAVLVMLALACLVPPAAARSRRPPRRTSPTRRPPSRRCWTASRDSRRGSRSSARRSTRSTRTSSSRRTSGTPSRTSWPRRGSIARRCRRSTTRWSTRLNARAHEAYIEGPGSDLEFILGATSLTDLSDRVTFLDAVQQSDADLANEVQNIRNQLDATIAKQEVLQAKAAAAVDELDAKKAQLQANFDEQQAILASIEEEKAQAQSFYAKTKKQYQAWVKAQLRPHVRHRHLQGVPGRSAARLRRRLRRPSERRRIPPARGRRHRRAPRARRSARRSTAWRGRT